MASFNPNVTSGAETPPAVEINAPNAKPAAKSNAAKGIGTTALNSQPTEAEKPIAKHGIKKLSIDNALKAAGEFKDTAIKGVKTIAASVQGKLSPASRELYENYLQAKAKVSLPGASWEDRNAFSDLEKKFTDNKALKKALESSDGPKITQRASEKAYSKLSDEDKKKVQEQAKDIVKTYVDAHFSTHGAEASIKSQLNNHLFFSAKPEELSKSIRTEIQQRYRDDLKSEFNKLGADSANDFVSLNYYESLQRNGVSDPSMEKAIKDIQSRQAGKMQSYREIINNLEMKYDGIK